MEHGDPFARLTAAQHEAVFSEETRLAVHAGAGAGKTRVLTLRVARMVDAGVDPSQMLVVTFSRKAAQELRRRLWRLGVEGVRAGTFHATALELVEISRAERGQPPVRLITDRRRALERVAATLPGGDAAGIAVSLDTELTWSKAQGLSPKDYPSAARRSRRRTRVDPDWAALAFDRYEQAKDRQGLLDFDDLISVATAALEDSAFADAIHWRSRHILIDEFQDVNPAQFALVERLLTPTTTLFCVGDPNQSIYGFNGAEPGLLRKVEERLPGTRTIVLGANHRSTPEIVSAAATVLPAGDRREIATTQQPGPAPEIVALEDDDAEAAWVARRALASREPGGRWRSMAVLARTNAQLQRFAEAFSALGIPAERLAPELSPGGDPRSRGAERRGADEGPAPDAVALGTFHRSKGLEWPTVFVVGASEGYLPHAGATTEAQVDEERRLLYVALTRAERRLIITWAGRRSSDEPRSAPSRRRSPFLDELERHVSATSPSQGPNAAERSATRLRAIRSGLEEQLEAQRGKA
jgi:DNA helicase-2/ATP-dependent DNA helicase PcrA